MKRLLYMPRMVILSLLFCSHFAAALPAWYVRPTVCISDGADSLCKMAIELSFEGLDDQQHCIYLDDQLVTCWIGGRDLKPIQVALRQDSELRLTDARGDVLLRQPITVKSRQTKPLRRRVRQPWSVF